MDGSTTFQNYIDERGDVVKCVVRLNNTINTDYKILAINMNYANQIPAANGHVYNIPHRVIQPNLALDAEFIHEDALLDLEDSSSDDEQGAYFLRVINLQPAYKNPAHRAISTALINISSSFRTI